LAEYLYKVPSCDLFVYGAVLALLAIASAIACLVPARRATRVNPTEALRSE
jgi:ABC-type lipoprotein release transport system permease subunit